MNNDFLFIFIIFVNVFNITYYLFADLYRSVSSDRLSLTSFLSFHSGLVSPHKLPRLSTVLTHWCHETLTPNQWFIHLQSDQTCPDVGNLSITYQEGVINHCILAYRNSVADLNLNVFLFKTGAPGQVVQYRKQWVNPPKKWSWRWSETWVVLKPFFGTFHSFYDAGCLCWVHINTTRLELFSQRSHPRIKFVDQE